MAMILIAFGGQPRSAFLSRVFQLDELQSLRVGQKSYSDLLQSLPCLAGGATCLFSRSIYPGGVAELLETAADILQKAAVAPASDDTLVLLNLAFYPLDTVWLDNMLAKAKETSVSLLIQSGGRLIGCCLRGRHLAEKRLSAEWATVEARPEQMADLLCPTTVLRLFSSNFTLRSFNSLSVCRQVYFLKLSADEIKMRREYEFIKNVPSAVRPYYPQVGDFLRHGDGRFGYEVEIVPMLDVGKCLINGLFADPAHCRLLLEALERYLAACPVVEVTQETYLKEAHCLFVEKTRQRAERLLALPETQALDRLCQMEGWDGLSAFIDHALNRLERLVAEDSDNRLYFSHGDLFFANMLFDPSQGFLKLIDPRGCEANDELGGYRTRWYDLAKLSHSFLGQYDLMVYDMADIVMGPDLRLDLRSEPVPGAKELAAQFVALMRRMRVDLSKLRLYEASLFLSMIPLHTESPLRMQRQLLRALKLFNEKG